MSWLFCCGDKNQKTKDLANTVDLSKPGVPERGPHTTWKEGVEGLSGEKTKESQLLSDILTSSKKEKGNGVFKIAQDVESENYGTPVNRQFNTFGGTFGVTADTLNSNRGGNEITKGNGQQLSKRTLSDKRLSNYLMQAQKIIQRNQLSREESLNRSVEQQRNEETKSKGDNLTPYEQPDYFSNSERESIFDTDQKLRMKNQSHNNSKTRSNLLKEKQSFEQQRKSYINIGINYALTEEDSFCDLEQQIEQKSKQNKRKEMNPYDSYQPFSATNKDSKAMNWANTGKPNARQSKVSTQATATNRVSEISNKNTQVQIQNKMKQNIGRSSNNNVPSKFNSNAKKIVTKSDIKKSDKTIVSQKDYQTVSTEARMNFEKSINSSIESQKEEVVYPSQQSAFNFQPKYFKPQTTKNNGNSVILDCSPNNLSGSNGNIITSQKSGLKKDPQAHLKNSQSIHTNSSTVLGATSSISNNASFIPHQQTQQQFYMSLSLKDKGVPKQEIIEQ